MRIRAVLFAIAASLPLFAQSYSMTPSSGPSSGGTEVTITGNFTATPLGVLFGDASTTDVRRVDERTLAVVTPEHLPGPVSVDLFTGTQFLSTGLTFTYTGDVPASYERLLLPIFLNPIRGQFGSEFVTSFTAQLVQGEGATLHGLTLACFFVCPPVRFPAGLSPQSARLEAEDLLRNGNPGRFIFVKKDELPNVAMNLRVFDRSRSAENYGTEIPIVRGGDFREGLISLLNVPTDPRFRSTLRIYATGPAQVIVQVGAATIDPIDHNLTLAAGANVFQPATATFTTFPTSVGLATVRIRIPEQPGQPRVWAFVSVTNNDTQHITTITPRP